MQSKRKKKEGQKVDDAYIFRLAFAEDKYLQHLPIGDPCVNAGMQENDRELWQDVEKIVITESLSSLRKTEVA